MPDADRLGLSGAAARHSEPTLDISRCSSETISKLTSGFRANGQAVTLFSATHRNHISVKKI
jgi:hypothetical protein